MKLTAEFKPSKIETEATAQRLNISPGTVQISGTSDYADLENKPILNGVELQAGENYIPIPTATSELNNDSGYVTASEASAAAPVQSVNGQSGNVQISIPTALSDLENDEGFITEEDIPPVVTDLGNIDGEQYDWEIEEYLNTLQKTGSYMFLWDGFEYWVDIETLEVDKTTTVQQVYWGTEEGGGTVYYRNVVVENGEIVQSYITKYMTFDEVNSAFARIIHNHVRFATQSQSIWDYCNIVAMQNSAPIVIYFDSNTNKTYTIETYVGNRQPVYKFQRVTEMNDTSCFYQRSSYHYSSKEHWGNWYKFTGTVFTPKNGR